MKLIRVKSLRVWLVLLLAVLLPVRGALAVGMQCSTPGTQLHVEAQLSHGHEPHATHSDHRHHEAAAAQPDGGAGVNDTAHDHAGAADQCNLCSASCSATGLASASVTVAEQQCLPTVFPRLDAPPPNFVSGGQERPPRTI